ncbi:hypothetical protein K443DRAFT_686203 [Laccaria amethystina LaAM-08-1]|uniref:Secreted protein n=1 Tax=Laccaria amethystina LaAM-08-1 TaxID=1095629 RepID=A0A0C9X0Z3_9AGAR|nr:hypothetical protein K443DRAFT_686203 [Laccaria amethystina LaAM-08-1]
MTHKVTSRTMMLTILAAGFGSYQCGQRWSKLEKSWVFGNHTAGIRFRARGDAVMHPSLFRNTQDCITGSNSPFLDVSFQFLPSKTPWKWMLLSARPKACVSEVGWRIPVYEFGCNSTTS